jgi:hypothetical protein
MKFATDLGFQIDVFPRESVLQLGNLAVCGGIFHGKRNLIGNLTEESKIIFGKRIPL